MSARQLAGGDAVLGDYVSAAYSRQDGVGGVGWNCASVDAAEPEPWHKSGALAVLAEALTNVQSPPRCRDRVEDALHAAILACGYSTWEQA